jgi:flavin reductase (DIM6/NTAB) family NADH-FMN oxidoreductase RutF
MCERHQTQPIGNKGQTLLFGEVKEIYLDDDCANVSGRGRLKVLAEKINPLARLGAGEYASFGEILTATRPSS